MPIIINGQTDEITIGGQSVATDDETAPVVHNHIAANITDLGTAISAAITAQKASSTVYGVAKISVSGSTLTITTT